MARGLLDNYSLPEIAKRLLLLRKALGHTQHMMGELAGVTDKAWQNYEAGIRRIELDAAIKLEIATGAPQEWVYGGIAARMPTELGQKIQAAKRDSGREKRKTG